MVINNRKESFLLLRFITAVITLITLVILLLTFLFLFIVFRFLVILLFVLNKLSSKVVLIQYL